MKLISSDRAEVSLQPVRYQFPDMDSGSQDKEWDWDANWLIIRGNIKMADEKEWAFEDPCLTTREARELAQWLRGVAAGVVIASSFPISEPGRLQIFTEPVIALSLEYRGEQRARIRVHLSLEALPPWFQEEDRPDVFEFFVSLDVDLDDLRHAADDWDGNLASFPER
jgi:hypothetical protein